MVSTVSEEDGRLVLANRQLISRSSVALSCLRHLRELKLDSNRIVDITPLLEIDSLVKISCCDNRVAELDLRQAQWQRLESLDFAHNNISGIYGTEKLTALTSLSLGTDPALNVRSS
jgi:Leucine-rich repeat (LRR) protein